MPHKRIALLATGDELVNGDILNTNGQAIAQSLFEKGIDVGTHLVVSDEQTEIEKAIHFLLQSHNGLIITGGLGPTSDDRTRFALSEALGEELEHDEASWQNIQERFKRYGLTKQPESNRNQALFPQSATVIHNKNGTANACWLNKNNQLIFMLPGPPRECLPIFKETVLPTLLQHDFAHPVVHRKWLLFGVSEGQIAEQLDNLATPFNVTTGYRMSMPYVEFKAHAETDAIMSEFLEKAQPIIDKHRLNKDDIPASKALIEFLDKADTRLSISDQATKGYFEKAIRTVDNYQQLDFNAASEATIIIEGLHDAWLDEMNHIPCKLFVKIDGQIAEFDIPNRGTKRTINSAIELISQTILNHLA